MRAGILLVLVCLLLARPVLSQTEVNDITRLNPIEVARVEAPTTVQDVSRLVAQNKGPISIGGGRFSQGGQTACTGCLHLDMRGFNRIIEVNKADKTITVQSGATWRQIQEVIDPENLSLKIMQSYSNFTVGGSISVNCHGDYVGLGPLVYSIRSIKIVLADGRVVTASRTTNRDLFRAAVGGYGGIGVIVEATLDLAENSALERKTVRMPAKDYPAWFRANIANSSTAVLHHAVLYPPAYTHVNANTSSITDKPVTIPLRLPSQARPTLFQLALLEFVTETGWGKLFREHVYDRLTVGRPQVVWRNFEAADDVNSIEPLSRDRTTYVLQEYFVPVAQYDAFLGDLRRILNEHQVNVLNVAIRHARPDRETYLSWAPTEVFAFVLYYEQSVTEEAKAEVRVWTGELIQAAIKHRGRHYLPYQIIATREQFLKAYPRAREFFSVKRRVDPDYKFRNRLWEAYYRP